jgi:hypothetical protein
MKRREQQRRYRAKRRAEQNGLVPEVSPAGVADAVHVEVASQPEKPKLSLKERMLGLTAPQVKTSSANVAKRTKKSDANLKQVIPTVIAAAVALYTHHAIKDPYKMCAPSQEEVVAMISPYFSILNRYVEVTGHMSETVLDVIAAVLASITYGTRAYGTYVMIKEEASHAQSNGNTFKPSQPSQPSPSTEEYQVFSVPTAHYHSVGDHGSQEATAHDAHANIQNGGYVNNGSEAARVAELLRREYQGRMQLGLV